MGQNGEMSAEGGPNSVGNNCDSEDRAGGNGVWYLQDTASLTADEGGESRGWPFG